MLNEQETKLTRDEELDDQLLDRLGAGQSDGSDELSTVFGRWRREVITDSDRELVSTDDAMVILKIES